MASAGTVTLELDANSVKLIRELQKAQKQTKTSASSMGKSMKSAMTSMQKQAMASAKAVGLLATAVAASAGAMVRSQSQQIDKLAKTSDALGIQQEKLQALQLVSELTGLGAESLTKNLTIMQRRLGEIARKGGESERALSDIGVPIQDIIALKPDEQLEMLASALGGVENQAVKASIANDLFGRNGISMLKMLDQLQAEGLSPTIEMIERMGGALSRTDSAKVEQMNDAFTIAQTKSRAFAQQLTVGVSSGIAAILTMYNETESGLEGTQNKVDGLFDQMVLGAINATTLVGPAFDTIKEGFQSIWNGFRSMPPWVQELGVFGAVLFGKKGMVAVAATSFAKDQFDKQTEELKAIFGEDIIGGLAPAGDTSLAELVFGGESESKQDWAKWGEQQIESYLKAKQKLNQTAEATGAAAIVTPSILPDIPDFKEQDEAAKKVQSIISSTRTQVEVMNEQIQLVKDAIKQGITAPFEEMGLTGEQVLDRLGGKLKELEEKGANNFIDLAEMGKQAARNIQDGFVQFLMNPFEDGLKGMLKSFLQMLQQMIANVIASQILKNIFGGMAGSSNEFVASLGESFGGVRDSGGRGQAGKAYVINPKAGPEIFVPDSAGTFTPNIDEQMGGGGVNLSLTIDARDAGAEARIKDMIVREMVPQIISAAKSDTLNTLRRPRFA
jgi:hypothetical protein